MAILSEESIVGNNIREWQKYKLLNDVTDDETASDEVDITNAKSVTLFVESAAGVTGGVVKLDVSVTTGGPYFVAGSVTTNSASAAFADTIAEGEAGLPAKYARARIETVISGGASPSIEAYIIVQR